MSPMPFTDHQHPTLKGRKRGFGGKKAAPFRKGNKPRKPGTVHKRRKPKSRLVPPRAN